MNTLETVLLATSVVFFLTTILGFSNSLIARCKVNRLIRKHHRAVMRALRFRQQRDRRIADLGQQLAESQQHVVNWILQAIMLTGEVDHRQEKLETMHQDLKEESRLRASQAVHLEFQERFAKRLRELVQDVRVALAQEKSSRAREKLWLNFLVKVGQLAHGSLSLP